MSKAIKVIKASQRQEQAVVAPAVQPNIAAQTRDLAQNIAAQFAAALEEIKRRQATERRNVMNAWGC